MSIPLPFTVASLRRAIKGVEAAGKHVLGVKPDGTVIVGDKPIDSATLVPPEPQESPAAPERRTMGEYFNGGSRET
jgi:hypothetical protein